MVYRSRLLLTGLLIAVFAATPAQAEVLDDQTVYSDYSNPALAAMNAYLGDQSFGADTDYSYPSANYQYSDVISQFTVDLGDASTTAFNVRESDTSGSGLNDTIPDFSTSLTLNTPTYFGGFTSSLMVFDVDQIYASWQILGFAQDSGLQFDPGTSDIPEPATSVLVTGALAGLLLRRKYAR